MPGDVVSTMNWETPSFPSVETRSQSAPNAAGTGLTWPEMLNPSPRGVAMTETPGTGPVIASPNTQVAVASPEQMEGRIRDCCSGVPAAASAAATTFMPTKGPG